MASTRSGLDGLSVFDETQSTTKLAITSLAGMPVCCQMLVVFRERLRFSPQSHWTILFGALEIAQSPFSILGSVLGHAAFCGVGANFVGSIISVVLPHRLQSMQTTPQPYMRMVRSCALISSFPSLSTANSLLHTAQRISRSELYLSNKAPPFNTPDRIRPLTHVSIRQPAACDYLQVHPPRGMNRVTIKQDCIIYNIYCVNKLTYMYHADTLVIGCGL
jgi:hypothetical protein